LYPPGLEKLKEIVRSRVYSVQQAQGLSLENGIFDDSTTLEQACCISGGHVRNLILLMQLAIDYNEDTLPLRVTAIQQANAQLRRTYRNTVNDDQWTLLAKVFRTKRVPNDDRHRSLLFTRCLLEYLDNGETWHDVHPVLQEVPEFIDALSSSL
jgi:hypothetical protein